MHLLAATAAINQFKRTKEKKQKNGSIARNKGTDKGSKRTVWQGADNTNRLHTAGGRHRACHGCPISTSTLKRLWGYVKGYGNTRRYTFDVLCRYAGKGSWTDFVQSLNDTDAQSDFYGAKLLRSDSLAVGDCVEVTWQPNRHCLFRYLGGNGFVVERSENAKIDVGDSFRCEVFRHGQPLYLDEVCHKGSRLAAYVCGANDGVSLRVFRQK